jgi:8-oxo-dGTP diphosphatase
MIEGSIQFCPRCGSALVVQHHSGKLRPACPKCDWIYFPDPKVAVLVLIKQDSQVLLVQRLYDPQKGFWTLPSGFVDAGEDPRQAALRECQEETGLVIRDIQLLDVLFSQEHPHGASILIIYGAEVKAGQLRSGDDANQAAFFTHSNLPPLAFNSTYQILNKYF